MSKNLTLLAGLLVAATGLSVQAVKAEEATFSTIKIEEPAIHESSSYPQLVTLQLGQFSPSAIAVSNGTNNFDYGSGGLKSFLVEAEWAIKLVSFGGSLYFQQGLNYSNFGGNAVQSSSNPGGAGTYSLNILGIDPRLMYAADWFPWKPLVPFIEVGYQYSAYFQGGNSGLDSVEGGVGDIVSGLGARLWLNRGASLGKNAHPIFLSAKFNRVYGPANSNSVNLASTSFLGGLTLGL